MSIDFDYFLLLFYVSDKENEVEKIEFNGEAKFQSDSEIPYDAKVVITIHKKKEIEIPFSCSTYKKASYNEVHSQFTSLGFTDVILIPKKDLITGWIHKDCSVDKIEINGNSKF